MNTLERRATLSIASIFALRMWGIFMILPVFSLYAHGLQGATPTLIGLALGIYGFTQAVFQIPWGVLSDYYHRKHVIALGLLIFILGSLLLAVADSMWAVIIGRALQGVGAVGSATLALVADLTKPEQRTKSLAIIGVTIGVAFVSAMMLGPLLNSWLSVPAIFWLTAVFGLLAIGVLYWGVPNLLLQTHHDDVEVTPTKLKDVIQDRNLLELNIGIFILHLLLTASFVVIPILLQNQFNLLVGQQWRVYLPTLLLACVTMLPCIRFSEKNQRFMSVFLGAIVVLLGSQLLLWLLSSVYAVVILALWIFFAAFTLLEAFLPSLVSKIAPPASRGTAMGLYSSAQFLGIFVGGVLGGWVYGHYYLSGVFLMNALVALIWLFVARRSSWYAKAIHPMTTQT